MKLIISFSKDGKKLGEFIEKNTDFKHIYNREIEGNIKEYIEKRWGELEYLIFISSTGIAVRYIKDAIVSKDRDPGVLVIDDMGKNVISLLSGHLGGANKKAIEIGKLIDGNPIITTATDNRKIQGIDIYSKNHDLIIDRLKDIKDISTLMIEDKKIGFYSDIKIEKPSYKNIISLENLENLEEVDGLIIVSNKKYKYKDFPMIILRPKNIVLGIGCKKGKSATEIISAVKKDLNRLNISEKSIGEIGTIDIKKDEKGIIDTAKYFNVNLRFFSPSEIEKVEDKFEKSDFVKKIVGVYNVSEPIAYLLGKKVIQGKTAHDGITISIGER